MAEEDDFWLELRETSGGLAVLGRVRGEVRLRLVEAGKARELVDVGEYVAEDQDAVGFAPEGDVADGMAGDVEDLEAGDLVALAQLAVDRMAGADEELDVEAGDRVAGLALANEVGVLGGIGVALADPQAGCPGCCRPRGWRPGGPGGSGSARGRRPCGSRSA